MTLALVILGAILCVEVVDPDCVGAVGAGKEVATIAEFDFFAGLDLKGAWLRREFLTQHIIDGDLVNQGADDMETAWVEGNCERFIREHT